MELALETDCCGTGWRRRSWARGRVSPSVPWGELPSGGSPGRPPAFVSPTLGGVARGEPRLPSSALAGGRGGSGWVAWSVSVQISVARPPHPHATPSLGVWACRYEAGG